MTSQELTWRNSLLMTSDQFDGSALQGWAPVVTVVCALCDEPHADNSQCEVPDRNDLYQKTCYITNPCVSRVR